MQNVCPIDEKFRYIKISIFVLLQIVAVSGCPHRTSAGHLGNSIGRMGRQWRNPRGQVDNQIIQAQARRLASISTLELETPNCTTGYAQILVAFCAFFQWRSTPAPRTPHHIPSHLKKLHFAIFKAFGARRHDIAVNKLFWTLQNLPFFNLAHC